MAVIPIILCGGSGSRLWPLSREACPKPFVPMFGGETLIGMTYRRAANLEGVETILTVTNRELLPLAMDALADVGIDRLGHSFILEPFARDTGPAIALAALHVAQSHNPETSMLVMPADHIIRDEEAFNSAVSKAEKLALQGQIVTFGIIPERPETGYGYIETEKGRAIRFIEKPDPASAAQFLKAGNFLWNSGIFCFTAKMILEAMEEHCPAILDGARAAYNTSLTTMSPECRSLEVGAAEFATIPALSLDYAVMEKTAKISCLTLECGWSDVGCWETFADLIPADPAGNQLTGDIFTENTSNCLALSDERVIGLVGVDNLLVVDSPDAVLVATRDNAQDVKRLYAHLHAKGHIAARLPRTMHTPWGSHTVLGEGEHFKIKRIQVKPRASLSLQTHKHRSEHWVVVCGTAKVVTGETEASLATNQSVYIPCGMKHRLENPGPEPLVIIEVQSGSYLGDDDIVRYDDLYGRVTV